MDVQSTHISVYDLQVEENTAFGRWYSPGTFPLPDEDSSASLYRQAVSTLSGTWPSAGFEHYEVSNYAKTGFRSRHNQKYWSCSDVIGVGMSAASLVQGVRSTRPRSRKEYEQWVDNQLRLQERRFADRSRGAEDTLGTLVESNLEVAESRVDVLERVMLALRTADGLILDPLRLEYGEAVENALVSSLLPFVESGHVKISSSIDSTGEVIYDRVQLTDPNGFIVSNTIISTVFATLDDVLGQN